MNIPRLMIPAALLLAAMMLAPPASAQTMPGEVYHALSSNGHEKLAKRIQKQLDMREDPDEGDVNGIIERWEEEAGGPRSGFDWITVARLWTRAGQAAEAETALVKADQTGSVPPATLLLDQARVAFLAGDRPLGEKAYWSGCAQADEATGLQYWLDVEVLATPAELDAWDRFRRLPATQTDLCQFLRSFWAERSLASTMSIGARMAEHYKRVRYAQTNYRRRSGKKAPTFSNQFGRPRNAAYDDRGLLYVRMGPPARTASFAGNPSIDNEIVSAECYQPNESWAYDYPDGTRIYHFTTGGGTDDYWMIENLAQVYRCGDPGASGSGPVGTVHRLSPVNENRSVLLGPAASLVLQDLYRSRQGLDPRYAQAAQRMNDPNRGSLLNTRDPSVALESQRVLQDEREWTFSAAEFAITEVPEQPSIKPDSRLMVEMLQFRAGKRALDRVWVNALLEGDKLTPQLDGTSFRYRVNARLSLVDAAGELQEFSTAFEATTPARLTKDHSLPVRIPIEVPPGAYRYTLVIEDAFGDPAGRKSGNYHRDEFVARDLSVALPVLSDVAVSPDSGGSWSPLAPAGPDIGIVPSPAHRTGADGAAYAYFEAYNLTPGGRYETRIRFEREGDGGDAFDLTFPGEVPFEGAPRTRRTLRMDLSDAEPGTYVMSVTITDSETDQRTLPHTTNIVVVE